MADPLRSLRSVDNLINKLGKESGSIRAFHGSPYDFDRFDASKIGTGEGAQAYGHGLYFAQNPAVAKEYKNSVVASPSYSSPEEIAADYLFVHGTPQDAMRVMRDHSKWLIRHGKLPMYQQALKLLNDGAPITPKEFPHIDAPGRMYEVEIGYPEEALLDWDAPLGSQPQAVRDFYGSGGRRGYHGMIDGPGDGDRLWHNRKLSIGPNSAAKELFGYGIPGVRYLDRGSRAAGDGTRNYVIFPGAEDQIRILRKFGLLAPVATGAAMEQE